jgi:hypothetical protein
MEVHSRLYLLHINKTGGTSVLHSVKDVLEKNDLPWYPKPEVPQQMISDFNRFAYIQRHIGLYPIGKTENLSIACILRDPVERIVSNFAWSFKAFVRDNHKYANMLTLEEKLRFYLFEDNDHMPQNNMQIRFVCNSISEELFYDLFNCGPGEYHKHKKTNSGFIPDTFTDIGLAKHNLSSFDIVGTIENHKLFLSRVHKWFEEKYNLEFDEEKDVKSNASLVEFNGEQFSSKRIYEMLSQSEIDRVRENNRLDQEIYEYAKNLERTKS